jgi:uncharacterized membrane protein
VARLPAHAAVLLGRRARGLSGVGMALGTLFFAAALTPSLVPRTALTQGALAGASFATGYGLGVAWRWLWAHLELPVPADRAIRLTNALVATFCLSVAAAFLWRAAEWQNSIRRVMGMEAIATVHPLQICAVALATFAALLAVVRLFGLTARGMAGLARRFVPRRVATVFGVGVAVVSFWSLASGVFVRATFHVLDASFRERDALLEPERPQPVEPGRTGGPGSLVQWKDLGRTGREFVASGPGAAEIGAVTGRPAAAPIRVYVGLRATDSAQARVRLALAELKRVGAFDRAVLIVITPTGTGWIDPSAMDAVEYLHHGNIASVAVQYSYLSSPLALLVQPEYGADTARALFAEVYRYWTTLPRNRRPRLYLHGLSLGALHSEGSIELFQMIGDPIDGAMWSGPPFGSRLWRSVTQDRNPGSPAWRPEFRDGRFVRFLNQDGTRVPADAPWGPMRVIYLQYASDAVTFFDSRDIYRPPAWLEAPRGPDVSPQLRWYPIVTALQVALDMAMATKSPMGYGHVYAPQHYVDAWVAVTDVCDWSESALATLKRHLAQAARHAMEDTTSVEGAYHDRGG